MPKFLLDKLKSEYGADSDIPYKVANSRGAMRGSKETAKGEAMQAKHDRDEKRKHKARTPGANLLKNPRRESA